MVVRKTFLQILGIYLCLVVFIPSLVVHDSFEIKALDGSKLDTSLLSQECISENTSQHNVTLFSALTIQSPDANDWQNMTSNTNQNGQQVENVSQPEYNHLNLQVPCQVRKRKLAELKKKLILVLTAIRVPVSVSHNKRSPNAYSECFFPFVTTAQEIHNNINALFQAQQDGERYFRNLTKSQNAELIKINQSHRSLLQNQENELRNKNCKILVEIKTTQDNLKTALIKNESLHFLSAQRLEIEGKFKSICTLQVVETPEVIDPIPPSELDEPVDERGYDDVQPLFNTNCFIFLEDLQTIQILAEKSIHLIKAISPNTFKLQNFKHITKPANGTGTGTGTTAQCNSLLNNIYNATLQLEKNTNGIPVNLRQYQSIRVAKTIKAHNTQILNLDQRYKENKDNLEKKYLKVRLSLVNMSRNLTLGFHAIAHQNLEFKQVEISKTRQLARSLVECNKSASAAQAIQKFYCGLKTISETVPFYTFSNGISLYPLNITALENCQDLSNANTSMPSVVVFSAHTPGLVRNRSSSSSSSDQSLRMCSDNAKSMAPATLNNWADAIIQNSYDQNFNFSQESLKCKTIIVSLNMPQLISIIYVKEAAKSLKNLLKFIAAIEMPSIEASAYLQIWELIQKNNGIDRNPEISELAWRVKNRMLTLNNTEDRTKLKSIQHNLPKNIQRLVFSPNDLVVLSNKHSAGHALGVNESRNLCTNPMNGTTRGKIQKWKVHFIDNGRYISFENEYSGKILLEDTDEKIEDYPKIKIHREQWEVSTCKNGSSVRIRNRRTQNLLSGRNLKNC